MKFKELEKLLKKPVGHYIRPEAPTFITYIHANLIK